MPFRLVWYLSVFPLCAYLLQSQQTKTKRLCTDNNNLHHKFHIIAQRKSCRLYMLYVQTQYTVYCTHLLLVFFSKKSPRIIIIIIFIHSLSRIRNAIKIYRFNGIQALLRLRLLLVVQRLYKHLGLKSDSVI